MILLNKHLLRLTITINSRQFHEMQFLRFLLKQVRGERPLEPLRDVAAERRRIFATLLLFDRLADLVRFLSVHGWRKLLRWTGIEFLLRRRSQEI